jgi:hypothetical protein
MISKFIHGESLDPELTEKGFRGLGSSTLGSRRQLANGGWHCASVLCQVGP